MNPISSLTNFNESSLDETSCHDIFGTDSCECCPYGFHIDTDFVRYCDALLTALYTNHSKPTKTTNQSCTYRSIEKNFKMNFDKYLKNDLVISNNHDDSIYFFKDTVEPLRHEHIDKNYPIANSKSHQLHKNNHENHHLDESPSNHHLTHKIFSSEVTSDKFSINSKNDLWSSNVTAGMNIKIQEEEEEEVESSRPSSPTASSCISSSAISKTVLTQIRNHLAQSLLRVKELERQVSQISHLKDAISKLESERAILLEKLNKHTKCETETIINHNSNGSSAENWNNIQSVCDKSLELEKSSLLSITKCDSWSVFPKEKPICRSIGTLTNFAPCVLFRNVFVQTDLKSKDVKNIVDTKESITMTKSLEEAIPQIDYDDTDSKTYQEKGSQTENSRPNPIEIYVSNKNQTDLDDKISKTDNCYSQSEIVSNPKLSLDSSSVSNSTNLTTITTDKSTNSTTPTSSTQSIRLCEKCNEMLVSNHFDYFCSPENMRTISLPKIIKSDSGISVERRQMDNKITEENDMILVYPSIDVFENIPLSDESECSSKDYFKNHQNQNKKSLFIASSEIKAALKIINDNLFSPKKSFLLSKSVAVVKKNWFKTSSSVDSDYRTVESYLDFIEKYFTKLLDFIVNLSDTNGNTAIHYAISYNNFDIVSILLDSKVCDINKYNKAGYTATMLVSLAKIENELYRDIVERLFNQADVNLKAKQNGQTALMLAASHGRIEISKILLECGAEVNLQDNDGSTALMCAAEHGHSEVISLLLSHSDCDPLIEDNEGSTALKIALVNGHNDIGVLLYAGARNSNTSNFLNRTTGSSNSHQHHHHKRTGSFTYSSSFCHVSSLNGLCSSYRKSPPKLRRSSFSTPPFKN